MVDAVSNFFVTGEANADWPVDDFRMIQQMDGRRHDHGDSRLVVRAQECRAVRGDDGAADQLGEGGILRSAQHTPRVARQHEIAPVVVGMHDRSHVFGRELGRRIDVREPGDARRPGNRPRRAPSPSRCRIRSASHRRGRFRDTRARAAWTARAVWPSWGNHSRLRPPAYRSVRSGEIDRATYPSVDHFTEVKHLAERKFTRAPI